MKDKITIIYPYWESPKMFKVHQKEWMEYPKDLHNRIEFILVDDCSQSHPIQEAIIVPKDFPLRLYRIKRDVPWNWRAARNIGAWSAMPESWLFMTDMDLLLPKETVIDLFNRLDKQWFSKSHFYTFDRLMARDRSKYKDHPNTYFLHHELYRKVNGYDEIVSGLYGLDGVFRRRLQKHSNGGVHMNGMSILLFQREDISDASVDTLPRKEGRDTPEFKAGKELLHDRFRQGIRPKILSFPYERLRWDE